MSEERCRETVRGRHFNCRCNNRAKVERDGYWYCGVHDPVRLEEKRKAQEEKWRRESEQRQANWNWERAVHNVCVCVSTEELEQLGAGWLRRHLDSMKEGS